MPSCRVESMRRVVVGTKRVSCIAKGRRFGADEKDGRRQETPLLTDSHAVLAAVCRGRASRPQNASQKCTLNSDVVWTSLLYGVSCKRIIM